MYPEEPSKAPVISFLEKMTDIFMKAKSSFMNKRDLDSMRMCAKLYMSYKKEYMLVMNGIEEGNTSEEAYIQMLKTSIQRDKQL
jgi:ribosome-binding ATPase YchF (GTP1/OBG family)